MSECKFIGCASKVSGRGFCGKHYSYLRKGLTEQQVMDGIKPERKPTVKKEYKSKCNFKGCKTSTKNDELLCKRHKIEVYPEVMSYMQKPVEYCKHEGCKNTAINGYDCGWHSSELENTLAELSNLFKSSKSLTE